MNKTTLLLGALGLGVGALIYHTGWLNPAVALFQTAIMPRVTSFLAFLKGDPLASTLLGGLASGSTLAVAKSVYTDQKETAVKAVTTQSQTQLSSLSNQLFQSNKAQSSSEQTIAALQAQISELTAEKPDDLALMESQNLVIQKSSELERLRSDYNALQRLMAEIKATPQVIVH
jgi:septal ring factor EnvC (AmiA/AmiB activator)